MSEDKKKNIFHLGVNNNIMKLLIYKKSLCRVIHNIIIWLLFLLLNN